MIADWALDIMGVGMGVMAFGLGAVMIVGASAFIIAFVTEFVGKRH